MSNELTQILKAIQNLTNDVSDIKTDVKYIKKQQEENTQILKALEDNTQSHGATLEQLNHKTAKIEGNTKILEKAETKKFLKTGSKIVSLLSE